MPKRIQLSRKKGFRLPPNTVNVARPGKWGNLYTVAEHGREEAVLLHKWELKGRVEVGLVDLSELRGKDVACWCGLDEACHGDTLLELANMPGVSNE